MQRRLLMRSKEVGQRCSHSGNGSSWQVPPLKSRIGVGHLARYRDSLGRIQLTGCLPQNTVAADCLWQKSCQGWRREKLENDCQKTAQKVTVFGCFTRQVSVPLNEVVLLPPTLFSRRERKCGSCRLNVQVRVKPS